MVSLISIKNNINRGKIVEALLDLVEHVENIKDNEDLNNRVLHLESRLDNI